MSKHVKIGTQILLLLTIVAIASVGLSGIMGYFTGKKSLEDESFKKLTAIREMKADQIESYFRQIQDQVETFSEDHMIIEAMRLFRDGFNNINVDLNIERKDLASIDSNVRQYYETEFLPRLNKNLDSDTSLSHFWPDQVNARILQNVFIASNIHPTGSKYLLDDIGGKSIYNEAHKEFHPIIRSYLEKFGYYDIFLVDSDTGNIVYSVFKEVDFGTSLLIGPYSNTNIARAFRAANEATSRDFVKLIDYEPYDPSYNAHASFIASPIFDGNKKTGVLLFQMPVDRINDIMTNRQSWSNVGLGESGETYIVGDDSLIRNQSRFMIENQKNFFKMIEEIGTPLAIIDQMKNLNSTIGLQRVQTEGTDAALSGETGTRIFEDYRGVSVLSSFKPLEINDVNWVIMSEIDEREAFAYINSFKRNLFVGSVLLIIIIVIISLVFTRTITTPIKRLQYNANELAKGDLDVKIDIDGHDEVGDLAKSFNVMKNSIKKLIGDLKDSNLNLEHKVVERTSDLEKATEQIRTLVEIAPDAIITIDSDQNIVLFNPMGEKIFGFTANEVLGKNLSMLLPEKSREIHAKDIEKYHDDAEKSRSMGNHRQVAGRRKDGSVFPAETGITKMEINGKYFYTAFLRDITERRKMEKQLEDAFETIKDQKERMESELNVGKEIQLSMLPLIFPAFPDYDEFNIHAHLQAAREVGGDYYDFFFITEELFCFNIGDVSGKGVPAALFMAVTKTLIKSRATDDYSPSSIITHVNDELSSDNKASMFVTLFICILNIKTGEMAYTNAGHNPPYIKHADGSLTRLSKRHGPVVGAVTGMTYMEESIVLKRDDMVYLYTDGVTEAMDPQGELYSEQRLVTLLESRHYESSEDIINATLNSVTHFEAEADQADDITILSLKYLGEFSDQETESYTIKLINQYPEIERLTQSFQTFAVNNNIVKSDSSKISIVLDEIMNNIINYAYIDDDKHEIEVKVKLQGEKLTIVITDDGKPFNPFHVDIPNVETPLEQRKTGGLGIHLVRNIMDKVNYSRRIDKNLVKLTKNISTNA